MILPTKHIDLQHSIVGSGAVILQHLHSPQTVTGLWEHVRSLSEIGVYWRFVLSLDFLFTIGAIDLENGLIMRKRP
jgi:hypothetical protein